MRDTERLARSGYAYLCVIQDGEKTAERYRKSANGVLLQLDIWSRNDIDLIIQGKDIFKGGTFTTVKKAIAAGEAWLAERAKERKAQKEATNV